MQPRGPNALNMMAYANNQEQQQNQEMDEGTSSRPNINVKDVQDLFDNFVKDMQNYDKILSQVAMNIQQIEGENQFITDFYPKFIWQSTYEQEQEKNIVAKSDRQLAKIIHNLEINNKSLKEDMRSWVLQFAKTAKLTEVLISQNGILRKSIAAKNKEIVRLIQGIGEAENDEVSELIDNLEELREENGVLKEHFYRLKEDLAQKRRENARVCEALENIQKELSQLQQQKFEAEDQEEHLTKTLELLEQWRMDSQKRRRKLGKEKEGLQLQRVELREEKKRIEQQLQRCNREQQELEGGLKRQFRTQEEQKYQLMEEIHELGDLIGRHKNDSRYYEEEKARNFDKKKQYEKVTKDYQKRHEEGEKTLMQLKNQLKKASETEVEIQCQIDLENLEVDILKAQLKQLQEREQQIAEQWRIEAKRGEEQRNREVAEWQAKANQQQRDLAFKILQQRSELSTRQKELERWQQKVYDKKEELSDLKGQMKEIRESQGKLTELKQQLKKLQQS